ncbi:filament-like plant protein [Senna tora]|uniref:Filament-like plant protein n=1 Tax=Senna tora TaxID=362788 RepID=A0A834T7V2_9FABA|nr:filament-like plant protein [Senna tora]
MPSTRLLNVKIKSLPCFEKDGMIWIWPGNEPPAAIPPSLLPPSGFQIHAEIVVELPIEHGLLLDNLLDVTHAPFVHTSTFARGWSVPRLVKFLTPASDLQGYWDPYPIDMEFRPPCMVLSTVGISKPGKLEGQNANKCTTNLHQLHVCLPSSKQKTRLLYRISLDFAPLLKHIPLMQYLWKYFGEQVLNEDLRLLVGQQERMNRGANVWNISVSYDKLGLTVPEIDFEMHIFHIGKKPGNKNHSPFHLVAVAKKDDGGEGKERARLLLELVMEKKRWLWRRKSSLKSPGKTESLGSASSLSERYSDEQEAMKESPNGSNESHDDVASKAVAGAEDEEDGTLIDAQSPEVTSKAAVPTTNSVGNGSLEEDGNVRKDNLKHAQEGEANDGLRSLSEKLFAALMNVSAKEDLVKQHAKVAEEAIEGWEKAENQVAILKKQLEAATIKISALEDRVIHLDGALKECVRQLRQTREEQEQNIHDAVVKKTNDLESSKHELQSQLRDLQVKLDASNVSSSVVDLELCRKLECLEKENKALKHDLLSLTEELEIRTIERDLSTQTAETASKQHLESIKKVAKLEAECRRLKSMACKTSSVNDHKSILTSSSFCVESLTDSQSDSGERLNAIETDTSKCEPTGSDSWASALIAELDHFKNEKLTLPQTSFVKIDLMDDFLEMERIASLPETKNESFCQENSFKAEFDTMNQQIAELKEKLVKVEIEKAELETALLESEDCIKESQLQLREAEVKLEELQVIEKQFISMQREAQTISKKVDSLEAEVYKERAVSAEIAIKCKELEEELESKKQEEKVKSPICSYGEMKIKQEDVAVAAGKLAECQKTIASLGNQLKALATLEDFLVDTASIPGFTATPSLIGRAGGETWKLHSNGTFSPKIDSTSSRFADEASVSSLTTIEQTSPPSSSSSTVLPNHFSSEKSRNGFAKFFSRTKSGIRLEIE